MLIAGFGTVPALCNDVKSCQTEWTGQPLPLQARTLLLLIFLCSHRFLQQLVAAKVALASLRDTLAAAVSRIKQPATVPLPCSWCPP